MVHTLASYARIKEEERDRRIAELRITAMIRGKGSAEGHHRKQ